MKDSNFVPQDSTPDDYKKPLPEEDGLKKFGKAQGFFRVIFFDNGPVLHVHGSRELIQVAFTKLFITEPVFREAIETAALRAGIATVFGTETTKALDREVSIEYIQTAKKEKAKNERAKARRN